MMTRRKNIIKIAIIALLIGVISTTGSYAYFVTKTSVATSLKIKTGTLGVKFNTKNSGNNINLNFQNLKLGVEQVNSFEFKNTGNINERIEVQFLNLNENNKSEKKLKKDYLKYFKYELTFNDGKEELEKSEGNLEDLFGQRVILKNKYKKTYSLIPNGIIKAEIKITLDPSIVEGMSIRDIKDFQESQLNFKVAILGQQLNDISNIN